MPQKFLAFCMNVSLADIYILFSGTFLLMSYIRAVVSHCPISLCEKNVVAQTRTGVFLAYLNIAGVGIHHGNLMGVCFVTEGQDYPCIRRS